MPKPHGLTKRHVRELAKLLDEERAAGHVVLERRRVALRPLRFPADVLAALLKLHAELAEREADWRRQRYPGTDRETLARDARTTR